jgi:hypothetical protein
MKTNKYLSKITFLVLAVVLSFAGSAVAQKKKPVRRPTTKPTTATTTNALEIRQSADKVSIQIKNVTKFIFILGGVARGIEDADKDAKAGKLSKPVIDKNNQFKQDVINSIRSLKAGLAALEVEFKTKPSLRNYSFQLQGITELSNQSEDLATAGRFTDSGRILLTVVEKLSDTLVAMP